MRNYSIIGSWVIVDKQTGLAIMETSNVAIIGKINTSKYRALTAMTYLGTVNKSIKNRKPKRLKPDFKTENI